MDIRKIKKLVEILEESNLSEIEITEKDESVRLTRKLSSPEATAAPVYQAPVVPQPSTPATTAAAQPATDTGDHEVEAEGHVIRSPMVGTFYAAPNPESDPFVSIGQDIRAGDTVCIIEAMKMFNQIESEIDGRVVAVLVDSAQPVEFDQPLFIIRQAT